MASKASENKELTQIQPARKENLPALILLDLEDRGWRATSQLRHKIGADFCDVIVSYESGEDDGSMEWTDLLLLDLRAVNCPKPRGPLGSVYMSSLDGRVGISARNWHLLRLRRLSTIE